MRSLIALVMTNAFVLSNAFAEQALDQLLACRHTPDTAARLECYDRASDAALSAKRTDPPPASKKPTAFESNIVRISQPLMGRADFTLENGQVWRQTDADDARSAKIGDRVVVSKAFIGAYWLKIDGGRAWRVTLVR